jgi:DNA invertase Pin-like site-specific DNA recombinase
MKGYIGYIRVSTVKQGTKGVSLQEQRDAILRFAERNHFNVTTWLEEMETAAKQGRPIFNQAIKMLRTGKAQGIILHKLDRGARNLRDWAAIGELSDQGIEVHFVTESIDLAGQFNRHHHVRHKQGVFNEQPANIMVLSAPRRGIYGDAKLLPEQHFTFSR